MANINKRGAIGVCLSFEYSISRKNDYCYGNFHCGVLAWML